MTPSPRSLLPLALVLFVVLSLTSALALPARQEGGPAACASPATPLPGEELPTGVAREEMLLLTPLAVPDAPEDTVISAIANIVCYEAGTTVMTSYTLAEGETSEIRVPTTAMLVVLEGELHVRLILECVLPTSTGACADPGIAFYSLGNALDTRQMLSADEPGPVVLAPGSLLVLSGVRAEFTTPDGSHARFLSAGLHIEFEGGAGCNRGCYTQP